MVTSLYVFPTVAMLLENGEKNRDMRKYPPLGPRARTTCNLHFQNCTLVGKATRKIFLGEKKADEQVYVTYVLTGIGVHGLDNFHIFCVVGNPRSRFGMLCTPFKIKKNLNIFLHVNDWVILGLR